MLRVIFLSVASLQLEYDHGFKDVMTVKVLDAFETVSLQEKYIQATCDTMMIRVVPGRVPAVSRVGVTARGSLEWYEGRKGAMGRGHVPNIGGRGCPHPAGVPILPQVCSKEEKTTWEGNPQFVTTARI